MSDQTGPEQIHLPGPSLIPFICAVGITLTVVGLTTGWVLLVAGLVITVATIAKWITLARREFRELPPG